MSFIAQPIIALNNRIRGIITLLNSEKHDDLKSTTRKPQFKSSHGGSLASGSGGKDSVAGDSIFKSEEELEAFSTIHELQDKLAHAKMEIQHYEESNDGLRRENGAMRVDMNRAVIELEELVKQLGELKAKVSELQNENKELAQEKGQLLDMIEDEDEGEEGLQTSLEEEASMIGANLADALSRYKNPDYDSPFRSLAQNDQEPDLLQAAGEQSATTSDKQDDASKGYANAFGKTKKNEYQSESEAESGRDDGSTGRGGILGLGRRRRQTGQSSDEKGPLESDDESIGKQQKRANGIPIIGGMFHRNNQTDDNSLTNDNEEEHESDPQRRGLFKGRFRRNNNENQTDEEGDTDSQPRKRRPRRGVFGRGRRSNDEDESPDLSQYESGQ